eukprot:34335_1
MGSTTTALGAILLILSWSFGIILIYSGHRFYTVRRDILIIKRRGSVVLLGVIGSIVLLMFGYPLTIILYWPWDTPLITNPTAQFIGDIANDLLYTPAAYFSAYLYGLRYWLIYYDIQFANSCLNLEWKQYITSSMDSICKEKWFIEHRSNYGNDSFMLKRIIILTIILFIIQTTLSLLYSPFNIHSFGIYSYTHLLFYFIPVIFSIIIYKKIPQSMDTIFLSQEAKLIFIYWLSALAAYVIVLILGLFLQHPAIMFIGYIAGILATFIISFICTFWVLITLYFRKGDTYEHMAQNVTSSQLELASVESPRSYNTSRSPRSVLSNIYLQNILQDSEEFNSFMRHLISEFSHEILMSYIEMQQYKMHVINVTGLDVNSIKDFDFKEQHNIVLPESVPKSDIVYNEENKFNYNVLQILKHKAYGLYIKYIRIGSQFEINLSYRQRVELTNLMEDYDLWMNDNGSVNEMELFQIWDGCIAEMISFMNHAKTRYLSSVSQSGDLSRLVSVTVD